MDLLVCVGGGGQHIALAVARMVRLGVWTGAPKVLVIDADLGSPLAQRLRQFAEPSAERAGEQKPQGPQVPHPLSNLQMEPPLATGAVGGSFRSAFLGSHEGGGDNPGGPVEEELYELFYDADADAVNIHHGMAARPAVGAAIFADKGIEHLKDTLEGAFKGVQRILVASSFIGGTGAGVTHQLVRFLHDSPRRDAKVSIYGSFLLQWLQLAAGGRSAANDLTMTNSASHGIQHFIKDTAPRLTSALLVGAREPAVPTKANESQDETVSVFPLLAAYGMTKLASDTAGAKVGDKKGENIFTITTESPKWHWLLQAQWFGSSPTIAERWAATRVVESIVQVFEDPAQGVEFRQLAGPAFRKSGIAGLGEQKNWGTAIRGWAEKKGVKDVVLAADVLHHLSVRMKQMGMVTGYLHEIFGSVDSVLGSVGSNSLQSKYAGRATVTKEQAYGYLASALRHQQKAALAFDGSADPAARLAQYMEEALMEEVVTGQVIG